MQLCKKEVNGALVDLPSFLLLLLLPPELGSGRGRHLLRLERPVQRHDQLPEEDEARGERRPPLVRHGQDGRDPAAADLPGLLQAHLALPRLRTPRRRVPRGERAAAGPHDSERDAEGEDGHERREGATDHRAQRRRAE